MKIFRKFLSIFTAALMCFLLCVPVCAEDSYLGAGAFVSGYDVSLYRIEKGNVFDITITSYIPVENIDTYHTDLDSLFSYARADNTESFIIDDDVRTGYSIPTIDEKNSFTNQYFIPISQSFLSGYV